MELTYVTISNTYSWRVQYKKEIARRGHAREVKSDMLYEEVQGRGRAERREAQRNGTGVR